MDIGKFVKDSKHMKNFFILIRKIIYFTLFSIDNILQTKNSAVVLCYHSISNDAWRFSTKPELFILHINKLLMHGYNFITVNELLENLQTNKPMTKSVVLTFDDGYKNILRTEQFLEQLKIKPCIFVIADTENYNFGELALNTKKDFLSIDDIKMLYRNGWSVGAHSLTHINFSGISKAQIKEEVITAKEKLQADLGINIDYFAYPKGNYTSDVLKYIRSAGYTAAFSMDDAALTSNTDLLTIPRVGIDSSHGINEVLWTISPSVIKFRKFIKKFVKKQIIERSIL